MEYFLSFIGETLQDNEVLFGTLHTHDIHYLILVYNLEWKLLGAQLTVKFVKFDGGRTLVDLLSFLGFKPSPQTFQMNSAYSSNAFAG